MTNFNVTLAVGFDPDTLTFPKLASTKLDGIRATIQDGVVLSRNGKPIRNKYVQSVLGHSKLNGLDGELIVGSPTAPDAFRKSSAVMAFEGEPEFTFFAFDHFHSEKPFTERFSKVERLVETFNSRHLRAVSQTIIRSVEELDLLESQFLEEGFEGVMLRNPQALYAQKRVTGKSQDLLKVKRFSDAEATIIGYEEEVHGKTGKLKGSLGKFMCETPEGVVFGVGGGYTKELRQEYWDNRHLMLGKIVKYKYFAVGVKDAPRFPTFIGIRDEDDMS